MWSISQFKFLLFSSYITTMRLVPRNYKSLEKFYIVIDVFWKKNNQWLNDKFLVATIFFVWYKEH